MDQSTEAQNVTLVVVGDGSVGKTSLLLSYTTDKFPTDYIPTIFENYAAHIQVDGRMINLNLWDTAGQESYDNLRVLSYGQADVFIITFSVVDAKSFENAINKWHSELQQENQQSKPIIFIGNKIDMRIDDDKNQNFINQNTAKQQINELNCQYYECSAKTQQGLKNIFEEAVRKVLYLRNKSEFANRSINEMDKNRKLQHKVDEKLQKPQACCCNVM